VVYQAGRVVGNERRPECFAHFLSCVDADQDNVFLKTSFVEMIDRPMGGGAVEGMEQGFPAVDATRDIREIPSIVDFVEISEFPPIMIDDPRLRECPTVRLLEEAFTHIYIDPLAAWADEMAAVGEPPPAPPLSGMPRFDGVRVRASLRALVPEYAAGFAASLHVVGARATHV
jgi:hypothetical protein